MLDTLALAYAEANELDKAVESQVKAVELAPKLAGLRLNLAKLYLRSNDKVNARAELDRLAVLGNAFVAHAEVTQLLKQLGG